MISKIIQIGNKVEFTKVQSTLSDNLNSGAKKKVYISQVYEVIDETRIKVAMPIENGHIVAVSTNTRLDACFYTPKGLYNGRVAVVERMKEDNLHVMIIELMYELEKFQRRQYYRLNCTMDLQHRIMSEEESASFLETGEVPENNQVLGLKSGVALDFSGGGVRFVSNDKYNKNDLIFIKLKISYDDTYRVYLLAGRVIASAEGKNRRNYEHRIEFIGLDSKTREEIIRYIFREERRQRQMDIDAR